MAFLSEWTRSDLKDPLSTYLCLLQIAREQTACLCACVCVCALHLLLHATLEQHGNAGLDGEGDFSPANVQVLLQRLAERRLLHPRFCKNKSAHAGGMFGDALLTIKTRHLVFLEQLLCRKFKVKRYGEENKVALVRTHA